MSVRKARYISKRRGRVPFPEIRAVCNLTERLGSLCLPRKSKNIDLYMDTYDPAEVQEKCGK